MKSILLLMMSTGGGQLIAVAITPLLSRLFDKEAFGELGTVVALAGIMAIVCSLKSEQLLLQSRTNDYKPAVMRSARLILLNGGVLLVVSTVIALAFSLNITMATSVIIGAILLAFFSLLRVYLSANRRFKESALANIKRGVGQSILQLSLFFLQSGLIVGWLLSFILPFYRYRKSFRLDFTVNPYKELVGQRLRMLKISSAGITSEVTVTFIIFSVFYLYGAAEAGVIAMVYRVMGFPVMVVSRSVADYMLPIYRQVQQNPSHRRVSIPPLAFCVFCGASLIAVTVNLNDALYVYILGDEWAGISHYFSLLAPLFAIRILSMAISPVYIVFFRENGYLIFSLALLIGYFLIAMYSVIDDLSFDKYVTIASVYGSVCYLIYCLKGASILFRDTHEN